MNAVAENDIEELARLEGVVADGLRGWFQAGLALKEIRDKRLYKASHTNFASYALDRWGMDKSRVYQRIWACEAVMELGCPQETSEYALDLIYRLGDEKKKAWDECVRRSGDKPVTARLIRDVCSELNIGSTKRTLAVFQWPAWLKAQFIAMDADGNWSAFSERPTRNRATGSWQCTGDETWLFSSLIKWTPPRCSDWEQSLMERPSLVEAAA